MIATSHAIGALVGVAAGLAVMVLAEPIAAALLRARTDAQRHGSLLNAERTERTLESFNTSRARRLEVWLVRGFGSFLVAGGALVLVT